MATRDAADTSVTSVPTVSATQEGVISAEVHNVRRNSCGWDEIVYLPELVTELVALSITVYDKRV